MITSIQCGLVTPYVVMNPDIIDACNNLVPDDTKALPESMLTHQYGLMSFTHM